MACAGRRGAHSIASPPDEPVRVVVPWLDDGDVKLYHGDAAEVLSQLPAGSVQTCVTSPPYWGLRDYGTGEWAGGSAECDHAAPLGDGGTGGGGDKGFRHGSQYTHQRVTGGECGRCGARRVDAQLGLEATPDEYVTRLVAVFREVWRVLRDDGTLWLNLGDSYAGGGTLGRNDGGRPATLVPRGKGGAMIPSGYSAPQTGSTFDKSAAGLKPKDLVGIPWRVAFALQADGWYLRSDIIWAKPNPMPESVTDRPTKAHEYVFLLAKQPRYYWDADAVREAATDGPWNSRKKFAGVEHTDDPKLRYASGRSHHPDEAQTGRNARSVWQIATQPTPEAHFATFPEELARRCIQAGTSEAGGCSACGVPWQRIVASTPYAPPTAANGERFVDASRQDKNRKLDGKSAAWREAAASRQTTGWVASCACDAPVVPQRVLDPFAGSGTTALVARHHGRRSIGVDLSEEYLGIAARRLQQLSLLV